MALKNNVFHLLFAARIFLAIFFFAPIHAHAISSVTTGLIGHYSFNEGSGTSTADSSGNTKAATLKNGAGWSDGKFGQAIQLNNNGDYVSVPDAIGVLNPSYITVSAWVNPAASGSGTQYIVSKHRDCCGLPGQGGYGLRINNITGKLSGEIWLANTQSLLTVGGQSPIPSNTWTHVAMVFDGTHIILYVNGVQDGISTTISPDAIQPSNKALTFGVLSFDAPTWYAFKGKLDEIWLYGRALSAQEIAGLASAIGGDPRLLFYESFDSAGSMVDNGGSCGGTTCAGFPVDTGKFGKALRVAGTTLSYPLVNHFNTDKGTVSFWFQPSWDGVDKNQHYFFDWESSGANFRILTYAEPTIDSYLVARTNNREANSYLFEPGVLRKWKAGEWHKIDVMWDSQVSPPYLALIVDSKLVNVVYSSWGAIGSLPTSFSIGAYQWGLFPANGVIDELKIYNESLIDLNDPVAGFITLSKGDGVWQTHETIHNAQGDAPVLADSVRPGEILIPFQARPFEAVFEGTQPDATTMTDTMQYAMARDGFEPLFFNLYSRRDLASVSVTVSDFTGPGDSVISPKNFDVRVVKNWFQAGSTPFKKPFPVYTPELLLQDELAKDAQNLEGGSWGYDPVQKIMTLPSLPPVPLSVAVLDPARTTRASMQAYTSKQFVVRLHALKSIPPGTYTATVNVQADALPMKSFTMQLQVYPFDLQASTKDFMIYHRGITDASVNNPDSVTMGIFEKEVLDIRDHGFNGITIYESSLAAEANELQFIKNSGINGKVIMPGSLDINTVKATVSLFQSYYGTPTPPYAPYFLGVDEPNSAVCGQGWSCIQDQINLSQVIHAGGGKVITAIEKEWADKLKDPANYNAWGVTTGVIPQPLDYSNLSASPNGVSYFQSLVDGTQIKNDSQSFYWQIMQEDPRVNRFMAGFYFWNTGLDGIFPYVYQHIAGNPYNDFDVWSGNYRDHLVTYPSQEGPVPTMQWEALREGINDVRYLTTWQNLYTKVLARNASVAQASKANVDATLLKYKTYMAQTTLPVSQFDDDRRLIISEIISLNTYLKLGIDLLPLNTSATRVSSSNTQVSISEIVKNQGYKNAGTFAVRYFLSTNATYELTDIPLVNSDGSACKRNITSLNAGATSPAASLATTTCYRPKSALAGVPYNVLVVDDWGSTFPGGVIAEYNETNNVSIAGTVQW